jgi:hypothetical protein
VSRTADNAPGSGGNRLNVIRTRAAAALLALVLSGALATASEAQRGQPEPPPLETTFEPMGTQVEFADGAAIVTFGDRTYRVSDVVQQDGSAGVIIQGEGRWYSAWDRRPGWRRGDLATRSTRQSTNEIWLLPGYGFISHWPSQSRDGREVYDRQIIRGSDGAVNPPGSTAPGFSEELGPSFVRRSGVRANPLIADRTLFIAGSARPTPEATSRAWLFDDQGVVEQWSPLVDVGGVVNEGNWPEGRAAVVYQRVSDQGHVTFGTPGLDGRIDLHVISPDLDTVTSHPDGVLIKLRPDNPNDVQQNGTPVEGIAFEPHFPNPVRHETALLAPAEGRPGLYRRLETDGRLTSPNQSVGFIPMSRRPSQRNASLLNFGPRYDDRPMATGFLLVYETESGVRYGWASSQLSHHTGPIWRDARIIESPRLTHLGVGLITQILVAQTDEGFWRSFVEPVLHDPDSVWDAPNDFGGFLPPASTAEDAALMAERALEHRERTFREAYRQEWLQATAVSRAQAQANREWFLQERRRRMGERAAAWEGFAEALALGVSQGAANYTPSSSGRRPSALGADFYWEGDALYYSGAGRRVRVD